MWPIESIFLKSQSSHDVAYLAKWLYKKTCRTNLDQPGFCCLNLGQELSSIEFRRMMIAIKQSMSQIHQTRFAKTLVYLSATRFDQQVSTRFHLDGGPEECFIMLGYEPTEINSELEIADYSQCAKSLGLTPMEFMTQYNPMFRQGLEMLQPYITKVSCFSHSDFQIVCVNNSMTPLDNVNPKWQGTLHTATIPAPDPTKRRVINSTMIASAPVGTPELVSSEEQTDFATTNIVRRKGYDKLDMEDDQ